MDRITDETIVQAAKYAEGRTGFNEVIRSPKSRGVNSAYGIGFIEGAVWLRDLVMRHLINGTLTGFYDSVDGKMLATAISSAFPYKEEGLSFGDEIELVVLKKGEL